MRVDGETPYIPTGEELAITTFKNEFGEELEVVPFVRGRQPDDRLKLSLVRKVSPKGFFLPKRGWIPTVPNSFGLPPGETCPGKTEFCESCYAFKSMQNKGVRPMLDENYAMLKSLETVESMTAYLVEMIERYQTFAKQSGVAEEDMVFRIHWSGDFYSIEYARAWAEAVKQFPDILFWVYTRSFRPPVDVIPEIDGIDNLVVFLSTDTGNIDDIKPEYAHLHRANSARDVIHAKKLARQDRRTITCPENLNRLELMQNSEGACIICRACFAQEVDVNFVTSGKYDDSPRSRFASGVAEQPVEISDRSISTIDRERYILGSAVDSQW